MSHSTGASQEKTVARQIQELITLLWCFPVAVIITLNVFSAPNWILGGKKAARDSRSVVGGSKIQFGGKQSFWIDHSLIVSDANLGAGPHDSVENGVNKDYIQ